MLNLQSQQNIIHFILLRLFITFINTEIFAPYAGSCEEQLNKQKTHPLTDSQSFNTLN